MAAKKQLKLADECIKGIAQHFDSGIFDGHENHVADSLGALLRPLDLVVDEAQNGPPDGKADGSIDGPTWRKAKRIVEALRELQWALEPWNGKAARNGAMYSA